MRARVQKWGNSLAIRIPKPMAAQVELVENDEVRVEVHDKAIVILPARTEWRLDELIEGISARNRHRPIDWGDAAGNESW